MLFFPALTSLAVYRSLRRLRGRASDVQINYGRPKEDNGGDVTANSRRNQWVMVWLRSQWGPENLDMDPVGSQYAGALNLMRPDEPYHDMVKEWMRSHMATR